MTVKLYPFRSVEFARFVLVQVPSSALAERVFSIVKRLFGDQQVRTLGDLIEIGVRAEMENVEFETSLSAESDDDSESDDDGESDDD